MEQKDVKILWQEFKKKEESLRKKMTINQKAEKLMELIFEMKEYNFLRKDTEFEDSYREAIKLVWDVKWEIEDLQAMAETGNE